MSLNVPLLMPFVARSRERYEIYSEVEAVRQSFGRCANSVHITHRRGRNLGIRLTSPTSVEIASPRKGAPCASSVFLVIAAAISGCAEQVSIKFLSGWSEGIYRRRCRRHDAGGDRDSAQSSGSTSTRGGGIPQLRFRRGQLGKARRWRSRHRLPLHSLGSSRSFAALRRTSPSMPS